MIKVSDPRASGCLEALVLLHPAELAPSLLVMPAIRNLAVALLKQRTLCKIIFATSSLAVSRAPKGLKPPRAYCVRFVLLAEMGQASSSRPLAASSQSVSARRANAVRCKCHGQVSHAKPPA